jgi:uncharacterized protein
MADDKRGLASADEKTRQRVASQGGQTVSQDSEHMSEIGKKGGKAAQQSGHAHRLTDEERSRGGSMSGGNFANDPERAREAGRKGGSR